MPEASRIREAQAIFDGVADDYDTPAQIFGLGRYRAWHRELAALVLDREPARVLDMCTGTGAIAAEISARTDAHIVAVDITRGMLERARQRPRVRGRGITFVQGAAQAPPFAPGTFDVVVFSYLLRYVADVPGTIATLGRLVRPGGLLASLEFGVPPNPIARAAWLLYTRALMRAGLSMISPGWRRVGSFLGGSISRLYQQHPVPALESYFRAAGFDVHPARRMSLGGGIILSGTRVTQ